MAWRFPQDCCQMFNDSFKRLRPLSTYLSLFLLNKFSVTSHIICGVVGLGRLECIIMELLLCLWLKNLNRGIEIQATIQSHYLGGVAVLERKSGTFPLPSRHLFKIVLLKPGLLSTYRNAWGS